MTTIYGKLYRAESSDGRLWAILRGRFHMAHFTGTMEQATEVVASWDRTAGIKGEPPMTQDQKTRIAEAMSNLNLAESILDGVLGELNEKFDEMSETQQDSTKGQDLSTAINALEEVIASTADNVTTLNDLG